MNCRNCDSELQTMRVVMAHACFKCNILFHNSRHGKAIHIKRQDSGKWKIGLNPQLTKNQLWEQELEQLYEEWIARRIVDE